jgi:hypothetical protein
MIAAVRGRTANALRWPYFGSKGEAMMTRMGVLGATMFLLLAAAAPAWAANPGWVVQVCADKAYTWAHEVDVEVTDGEGKNKQDLVDWRRDSSTTVDFPVSGALANAATLHVEADADPYDAQAYICVLYGGKLARTIMFLDKFDATVSRTDTGTGCPCFSGK